MRKRLQKEGIIILLYASILITVVSSILSVVISEKADSNTKMVAHTYEVLQKTKMLESYLKDTETSQRGFLLTVNTKYLEIFTAAKPKLDNTVTELKQLTSDNPEQQVRISKLMGLIDQKIAELEETINLGKSGDLEGAMTIVNSGKGKKIMDEIRLMIADIDKTEEVLLGERTKQMESTATLFRIVMVLAAVFSLAIIIAAITTIKQERKGRAELFAQLDDYNKTLLLNLNNEEKSTEEAVVINKLIGNLKNATSFIKKIGSGDYNVEVEGLTEENMALNKENLVGELINMRDQMMKVAEAERERTWMTEGMAQFADILRKNTDDLTILSGSIISSLVNYVKANQGGIYLLNESNEGEAYLELLGCYAFNKKKFINKRIDIGEGLVGQVYLEREYIYITDLPDDYIHITSGLGGANPNCLLVVPLIVNEQICGVVELASFKQFKNYEIEFVQKIAESIAATIITVKTNQQTKRLLEESQAMTEQMRAQEEEMRQNLEEMQATQEQLFRLSQNNEHVEVD